MPSRFVPAAVALLAGLASVVNAHFVSADCPPDFNADGFVDFFDYSDFVAAFETGC